MLDRRQVIASTAALGLTTAVGLPADAPTSPEWEAPADAPWWVQFAAQFDYEYAEVFEPVDNRWVSVAVDDDFLPILSGHTPAPTMLYRLWRNHDDIALAWHEHTTGVPQEMRTSHYMDIVDWSPGRGTQSRRDVSLGEPST